VVFSLLSPSAETAPLPESAPLQPRDTFPLHLPQLTVKTDGETGEFSGVNVYFPESGDLAVIGMGEDYTVKYTSHGSEKTLFRKPSGHEGEFSRFEAEVFRRVTIRYGEALDTLGALLREKNWNRCRYFDAYFPHFLSGWSYLVCAARSSLHALPRASRPVESEFDVSLNSPKTDARIATWMSSADSGIALREAAATLKTRLMAFQKSLDSMKDRDDPPVPRELTDAIVKFIGIYFNRAPGASTSK
jgi:hypothetical protein